MILASDLHQVPTLRMSGAVHLRPLYVFIFEDGTDRLSRNVGNYSSTLRNLLEERRCHLHNGGRIAQSV